MNDRLPRYGLPYADLGGCDLPWLALLSQCVTYVSGRSVLRFRLRPGWAAFRLEPMRELLESLFVTHTFFVTVPRPKSRSVGDRGFR